MQNLTESGNMKENIPFIPNLDPLKKVDLA